MATSGLFGNYRWEISVHLAKIVKREITCHGHCFLDRVNLKMTCILEFYTRRIVDKPCVIWLFPFDFGNTVYLFKDKYFGGILKLSSSHSV